MTEQTFEVRSIEAARQQAPLAQELSWLQPVREAGLEQLARTGFPQRKTEAWKYTSIYPLTQGDFLRPAPAQDTGSDISIPGLDSYRLVFHNGVLDSQRSQLDGLPFELIPFRQANTEQRELIRQHLGSLVQGELHPFALLNSGWLQDGAFLRIGKDVVVDKPIQVVFDHGVADVSFSAQPRLFVLLERHAQGVLIEQHLGQPESAEVFSNTVVEVRLHEGAKLTHYQLNIEPESVLHVGNVQVSLAAHAEYESHQFAVGSRLKRRDLQVNLTEAGASARLFGIYLGRNKQHVDFRTVLDHQAPHCTSQESVKGIVRDDARAVFNGRIHIHRHAQKTSAEMSNKNLLLSRTAEVNTKPELEIYADDVKCAHGATVGQLDKDALFYLRSRGISVNDACQILSDAFVYEVLDQMPLEAIRDYTAQWVERFHDHPVTTDPLLAEEI